MRLIVGYTAASAPDIAARLIGQSLSDRLGQQFVIENKPGAGTNLSTAGRGPRRAGRLHPPRRWRRRTRSAELLHDNLSFNFILDIAPIRLYRRDTVCRDRDAIVPGADRSPS